ncbi:hypothetical protein Nepgr_027616 [Nepenthes gracilis]|uniref:Non-haem dioxygenase N-terminal domain-containing protein n=1 Tax=Nepenthes gracilis TaxID=150966 RepID=A0AAD3T953_NEPGR|nr:hypothetical protein Nepgr_027616 [Nepenthes gracilis]
MEGNYKGTKIVMLDFMDCNRERELNEFDRMKAGPRVPVMNLEGVQGDRRWEIVDRIMEASEMWGFFQMINHRIPKDVINSFLEAIRRFHEQPKESKMEFYTRDSDKKVSYHSTIDPILKTALWKDTFTRRFDNTLEINQPFLCRIRCLACSRRLWGLAAATSKTLGAWKLKSS